MHGGIRSAGMGKFRQTLLGPALSLLIESTDSFDKRTDNWLLKTLKNRWEVGVENSILGLQ